MQSLLKTALAVCATFCLNSAGASNEPVSMNADGVAGGGHDVTRYQQLKPGQPAMPGSASYAVQYKGATWHFVNKDHRDRFSQNPEQYTPAFNGHCANALALGEGLIPTSGKTWLVLDDQLYFFFAPRGAKRWSDGNYKQYLSQATAAWKAINPP